MARRRKITSIISHFKLDEKGFTQGTVDFFNINLDKDNLAFFDYNRVLKHQADPLYKKMADNLRVFVLSLFTHAARNKEALGLKVLDGIKECNDTRLGYSKNNSKGVSIGGIMKPLFLQALSFLKVAYINDQISFNTLRFGIDHISYDRVSDICVSVNVQFLIEYTKEQCNIYNIPCESKRRIKVFDIQSKTWRIEEFVLPEYRGKTIIFIPKKLISSKARAICTLAQFISYGFKNYLKDSPDIQHLKNQEGKILYKDYKEYLKKLGISRKQVAKMLMSNHKLIISEFQDVKYPDIQDLSTEELISITNS